MTSNLVAWKNIHLLFLQVRSSCMSQIGPQLRVSQDAVKMLPIFPPLPPLKKRCWLSFVPFWSSVISSKATRLVAEFNLLWRTEGFSFLLAANGGWFQLLGFPLPYLPAMWPFHSIAAYFFRSAGDSLSSGWPSQSLLKELLLIRTI